MFLSLFNARSRHFPHVKFKSFRIEAIGQSPKWRKLTDFFPKLPSNSELPPRTVVSRARLTFRCPRRLVLQSVQLGGQSKDAPLALSLIILTPKRVNRAITRGKCPTTSPGLRHDRLALRVGACLSWSLPLSCSTMNASPIRGSLISNTMVASKISAGSELSMLLKVDND